MLTFSKFQTLEKFNGLIKEQTYQKLLLVNANQGLKEIEKPSKIENPRLPPEVMP
jgi:hypothetical protein